MSKGYSEYKTCCTCGTSFPEISIAGNPYRRCPSCRKEANEINIKMSKKINWEKIK